MSHIKKLIKSHDTPEVARITARLLVIFFFFILVFLTFVPWQQTSSGTGRVIAFSPTERIQNIHATVSGRISKWFAREGQELKKGEPIMEVVDVDPKFMERLKANREAVEKKYIAAKQVTTTAEFDFKRQEELYKKGFSARKDFEQASITYRNAQSAEAQAQAELVDFDSKLERQKSQLVTTPVDGTVIRLMQGSSSVFVNQGDVVAVFVPKSDKLAAEFFIPGVDLPLVHEGRKVRLQFEGWPAVQFSGWPAVAVGTFGAVVTFVDQTANENGEFRVIVRPNEGDNWPESRFIRQGARVNGWILLNEVSLGYELWRRFNGFPPSLDKPPERLGDAKLPIQ